MLRTSKDLVMKNPGNLFRDFLIKNRVFKKIIRRTFRLNYDALSKNLVFVTDFLVVFFFKDCMPKNRVLIKNILLKKNVNQTLFFLRKSFEELSIENIRFLGIYFQWPLDGSWIHLITCGFFKVLLTEIRLPLK